MTLWFISMTLKKRKNSSIHFTHERKSKSHLSSNAFKKNDERERKNILPRGHQTRLSFKWKQSLSSSFFKSCTFKIIFISHINEERKLLWLKIICQHKSTKNSPAYSHRASCFELDVTRELSQESTIIMTIVMLPTDTSHRVRNEKSEDCIIKLKLYLGKACLKINEIIFETISCMHISWMKSPLI